MHFVPTIVLINRYFHPDLSATSQMASDMAFAMVRFGYDVRIVTSRQRYERPGERLPARECTQGVYIRRVWTTRFGRSRLVGRVVDYLTFYLSAFVASLLLVSKGDIIVAKTDPPLISVVAWAVARLRQAKLINWLQDLFPEVALAVGIRPGRGVTRGLVWLRDLSLRAAEINVVLGGRMQQRLEHNGISAPRIEVIPNWADGAKIRPIPRENSGLRWDWGLEERFVVGYSGNLGRAHEFQTMVEAMKRSREDGGIVFLFIGGGSGMQDLKDEVTQAALRNAHFLDYQPAERLAESLSVPDVHLVSLRPELEGLIVPSKIYGIMAAGRPVIFIGDPAGEVGRLITECGCGFSVRVGDIDALVSCLRMLEDDPGLAAAMGCRGRACFDRHYDLTHGVRRWRAVLDLASRVE
jgi:glycosyltransferase involved in cell wall biosynthesis